MYRWLKRLFSVEDPRVPLTSANIQDWLQLGQDSNAGVQVNEISALGVPAFLKAVNLISHSVAKTPLHIYRRTGDGRERARQHPADKLLNGRINPYQSSLLLKDTLQKDCVVTGNGYAWIERDDLAKPVALWRLNPQDTAPEFTDTNQLLYKTRIKEEELFLLPENVFHIKGIGDGIVGYGVLAYLSDCLGLGIAQQRYAARFFANGAIPPVALKLQGVLKSEEARSNLRRSWQAIHSGPSNAHKLAILEEGAELETLAVDAQTAQLVESRKLSLIDFANALGIPASWLGAAVNTSYKSLEHEDRAFLRDGLDFWLCQWEAEAGSKLLTERQLDLGTHYAEFKREALIRMETKDERSILLQEYHGGLRSWEECRQTLNEPADQEGFYLRPSNLTPETFEVEPPEPPQPPQAPPEPPGDPVEENEAEEPSEQEEPVEASQKASEERLLRLTASTLDRLYKRLDKASQGKGAEWAKEGLSDHWQVWSESLEPAVDPERVSDLFEDLRAELQAVSSKDWETVFSSKDRETIAEELLC